MDQDTFRPRALTEYAKPERGIAARPDRVALWAVVLAIVAMIAGAASAKAGSGGSGPGGGGHGATSQSKYDRLWDSYSTRDHRWARRTGECESGNDPNAIGGGGTYRGAFQFTKPTWRGAPKSPGGDPIDYNWKTQAVVAVALKHRSRSNPWPNCGKAAD
jgi:hypothetical protein